ncbi:NADPH-dependent FMN reductase [Methylorubrum extorquens]|uniref:Flavin-dependent oxidoreductase, putative chromate reductase n=1 Tax=Methylorubrum extorquens (strain ATCC 14718 / DSM 1338 / JCM 2805 / NCIMB 9133 / AM1) TaxID=272630 RepID=C5B5H2_METEA|nr:NAD(P)H-dependent oxidoreductase [Methylorubrum extorquens]ACS43704.1 flavin-dependent oxidoreductase, putative chromate reductase [Methylorubrum extorquens AM1]MCP1546488.1 chromate reductase [Methylorubrum extorquens]MCP1591155.1 chromate reductase [Methylorubrum extorquens]MDV2988494.1 NAD(P)H-dependent oxidoreductase [Methylobacteriaceae bacterium AG10]
MTTTIALFAGSLRKGSFNRALARSLIALAPKELKLEIIEIGDLPLYNQDFDDEGAPPATWTSFRDKVRAVDAVLFITPEYNRSVPAVLKNALDVGSRPYGKSVWGGKPGAVISTSQGALGGFGANHHLRQSLVCLDVAALQQPEAYIGGVNKLFDSGGNLVADDTESFLKTFLSKFAEWIEHNKG